MIRQPPRSTLERSSAASDVYKRQALLCRADRRIPEEERAKISLFTNVPEWGVISMWAVSYTHLRAHETVLDLVCRLLLEKKNNQRANYVETIQ